MAKQPLYGLTLAEIREITTSLGLPKFNATQIVQWLYKKHVTTIDEMTNLSKAAREALNENYCIGLHEFEKETISSDGTKKYLFTSTGGNLIETAYIPDKERHTLCVSSQAGCKMGCLFCMTAKQGFQAHLPAGEILNQLRSIREFHQITNLVYMGMGEPMDNIDEVLKSLEILTADYGYAMSPKRVTVSTIGVIPAMKKFLDESRCHLAISIHSPFDEERRKLMPIQSVYSIADVVETLKGYDWKGQRRLTFEYIVFEGINDTKAHINALSRLLHGLKCRINIIHFHSIPGSPLEGASRQKLEWFRDELNKKGLTATVRASRGEDIEAACGLLSTKDSVKQEDPDF